VGCFRWWSLGGGIAPGHTAVNNEVCTVDKAALVAGKEKYCLSLLNSLAETTCGEVDLAAVTLGLVVAEPVLEKWGAMFINMMDLARSHVNDLLQWRWAQGIEPKALPSVHHSQFPRHRQNCTLAGSVRKLGCRTTDKCYNTSSVDDACLLLAVLPEAENCVFATEPHTLDVDRLCQIPNLLGSVDRVVIS
jgi:hypothetical protein